MQVLNRSRSTAAESYHTRFIGSDPFRFRILDQSGVERNDGSRGFTPEEILRMDWLCENVDGAIPPIQALRPEAMETTAVLAIHPE